MKAGSIFYLANLIILLLISSCGGRNTNIRAVAGLDSWFNHEINQATGQPFHYLWSDTAWSGYSRWGEIFTAKGAGIETIGKPLQDALDKIDIYIIADPDTTTECRSPEYIQDEDIRTITKWVRNGGVLVLLANDAPNCEFTHLNRLASGFGMHFNHVTLSPVPGNDFEAGAIRDLPDESLFRGVSKIFLKDICDIGISGNAKPLLSDGGKVIMADCRYGKGYVFAAGDPWIYNEYIDHARVPESFDNMKAAENLTDLLLSHASKTLR